MFTSFLRRSLQIVVGLAFITPLIVATQSYIFPFIVPKILFFRSVMLIGLGLFALYILLYRAARPFYQTLIGWGVALFFVSALLSTIFSVDSVRSLWDNHERMLGFYTMLHYAIFYVIARYVFQTKQEWRLLFQWILISAIPFVVIGLYQIANPEYLLNQGSDRVRSTLGNTIYVSGYALFLILVSVLLFLQTRVRWERMLYGLAIILELVLLAATKTRGTMLGLGVVVVIGILMAASWETTQKHVRKILWGSALALVGIAALLLVLRDTSFVQQSPFLSRMTHLSLESGTGRTRTLAWGIAVQAWKDYPVVGWGLNNFFYAFNQYYEPEFLRFGSSETWFDNAHNILLNTLTTQGVVGVVAYLFLFIAAMIATWRIPRRTPDAYHTVWLIRLFLIAHFIHNLFVFENVTSYIALFLLLAYLDSLSHFQGNESPAPVSRRLDSTAVSIASLGIVVLVGWGIYQTNIKPGKANRTLLTSLRSVQMLDTQGALQWYALAKSYNSPHQDDIAREFAQGVLRRIQAQEPALMQAHGRLLYPRAQQDLQEQLQRMPRELRILLILGQLAEQQGTYMKTAAPLEEAEKFFRQALTLSPKRQQLFYELGQVYMLLGDRAKGESVYQQAITLYPAIGESYWRFAIFYAGLQDVPNSARYFREALAYGDAGSSMSVDAIQLAINVLLRAGDGASAGAYQAFLPNNKK